MPNVTVTLNLTRDAFEEGKHPRDHGKFEAAGKAGSMAMRDPKTGKHVGGMHGPFHEKAHAAAYRKGLGKGKVRSRPVGYTVEE